MFVVKARGFTLLEVLVALAVFAITAAALISGVNESVAAQSHLERKTLAGWVAQNQIAIVRLMPSWPDVGEVNGEEEMAGQTWFWKRRTLETSDPELRRVELEVRIDKDEAGALVRLVAFFNAHPAYMPKPMPRAGKSGNGDEANDTSKPSGGNGDGNKNPDGQGP